MLTSHESNQNSAESNQINFAFSAVAQLCLMYMLVYQCCSSVLGFATCAIVQVLLLLFAIEFVWRKSGELMDRYGYGSEYEVITKSFPSIYGILYILFTLTI